VKALSDVISSPIRMDKSESAFRSLTTRHGWTSSSRYTFCLAIHVVVPCVYRFAVRILKSRDLLTLVFAVLTIW